MNKQKKQNGQINRRRFIGITAAASAYSFIPRFVRGNAYGLGMQKPDSTFGGVKIGAITYSYRSLPGTNAKDTLDYLVQSGLHSCELMSGPIEESAGAPVFNIMDIVAKYMPNGPSAARDSVPGGEQDSVPAGAQRRRFQMPPGMQEAINDF